MTEALKTFLKWCNEKKPELENDKFEVEIFINPKTNNSSVTFEFSNKNIIGSIYGWESGDIECNCLYMSSGETFFLKKTSFMDNVTPIVKANSYLSELIAVSKAMN